MIAATALVLMMTFPGLALFYGGMVRRRTCWPRWRKASSPRRVVSLLWFALAYSLAFSRRRRAYRRLRPRLAARASASLGQPVRQDDPRDAVHGLSDDLRGHHLRAGRRRGRRPDEILGLSSCFARSGCSSSMCPPRIGCGAADSCAAWALLDFAGGTVVHINAGVAGLVAALMMGARQGYGRENLAPFDLSLAVVGTGLLWVGWFGFNGGSALGADSRAVLRHRRDASRRLRRRAGLERAGMAATRQAVGARADLRRGGGARHDHPGVGLCPALARRRHRLLAGGVCYWASTALKQRLRYDDSLDVFGVHGVGGMLGTLLAGVFATAGDHRLGRRPGRFRSARGRPASVRARRRSACSSPSSGARSAPWSR